jgi:hypothetical protein
MIRRIVAASVLTACTAWVAYAAQPATFVLKSGERVSGELTYKGGTAYTLNGKDYPSEEIALIAFVPGDPPATELNSIPNVDNNPSEHERHVFVMRDGNVMLGKIYKISEDGSTITFDKREGGRQDVAASQLARVYVNPGAARTVYASVLSNAPSAVATSGAGAAAGTITVPASQAWTDTGITVKKGDRLSFTTTGQITIASGSNPEFVATPDGAGNYNGARTGYPVPAMAIGGLIAKVNNGSPFPIGSNTQPITMPSDGKLYLGVNDTQVSDNSGAFSVTIRR